MQSTQLLSQYGYLAVFIGCLLEGETVLILAGLVSHFDDWVLPALAPLRGLGFTLLAVYGLWLVFGRKVDYTPAKVEAGAGHAHH